MTCNGIGPLGTRAQSGLLGDVLAGISGPALRQQPARVPEPCLGVPLTSVHWGAACLTPPHTCLTYDMELFVSDLSPQVDPAPLLGVVHPTEAGDVDDALLVHVHVAGCGWRKQRLSWAYGPRPSPPRCFGYRSTSENGLPLNSILCYMLLVT